MRKAEREARARIIQTARSQVGYRSLPLRNAVYASETGHGAASWSGSFVERVFASESIPLEAASTNHLLEWAVKAGRTTSTRPHPGDVAVYAFPVEGDHFGQPHVGIVTYAESYRKDGVFYAVEGETASGKPRGDQTPNGVFERLRFHTDVITFIRPVFRVPTASAASTNGKRPWIKTAQIMTGKKHKSVEYVQRALGATVGLREVDPMWYDQKTQSAMAAYQRRLGFAGERANGLPDQETLERLGAETGEFDVRG